MDEMREHALEDLGRNETVEENQIVTVAISVPLIWANDHRGARAQGLIAVS
jgi:hypothetical protein